jgi:hypothetical protein
MSKVSNFIDKEFNTIIKDSREYKSYELGVASGYFNLYYYIKMSDGVEVAKETFKSFIEGTDRASEYFRKLIEIDDEPSTKIDANNLKFEYEDLKKRYINKNI